MYKLRNTIMYGLITAGLYIALFANTETVMKYFTKGGWYAILPVMTAFLFSFAHGAFAGNFWSAMGIEPSRTVVQPVKRKYTYRRPRPRLYLQA